MSDFETDDDDSIINAVTAYHKCIDNLYLAAAQNGNLSTFYSNVPASPEAFAIFLSSTTSLKDFNFVELAGFAPTLTAAHGNALAAGFSRNTSVNKISIDINTEGIPPGADDVAATIFSGLHRHPHLRYFRSRINGRFPSTCVRRLLESAPELDELYLERVGDLVVMAPEDRAPLEDEMPPSDDIKPLLGVSVPTRIKKLVLTNMAMQGCSVNEYDSRLSVSQLAFLSCNFGSTELQAVLYSVAEVEMLEIFDCTGLESESRDPSISTGPGPSERIFEKHASTLKDITVKSTRLDNHNIADLSRALLHHDVIQSLSIRHIMDENDELEAMNTLLASLHQSRKLRSLRILLCGTDRRDLRLTGVTALTEMLRVNKSLSTLDLQLFQASARVAQDVARQLCECLLESCSLKNVEFPRVSRGCLALIAETLNNPRYLVEHVHVPLYADDFDDAEICQLLTSIGNASGLKSFGWVNVRDTATASLLLQAAERNPSLENIIGHYSAEQSVMAIRKRILFQLRVNHFRRRLQAYPEHLWSTVLSRMTAPEDRDIRYFFLNPVMGRLGREKPEARGRKRRRSDELTTTDAIAK